MRYVTTAVLGSVLAACGESDDVLVTEMERALRESGTALAVGLASVEILSNVTEEPDTQLRHSGLACGCPCTEKVGPEQVFAINLDYTGCFPDSGLFPGLMTGHASLQSDGTVVNAYWSDLAINLDFVASGPLSAEFVVDGTTTTYDLDGEPTFGEVAAVLYLRVAVGVDALELDGTVEVGRPRVAVTFDRVLLPWDDIGGSCPVPAEGMARLTTDRHDSTVRYARPANGLVTAEHGNRISDPADYCDYASDLL